MNEIISSKEIADPEILAFLPCVKDTIETNAAILSDTMNQNTTLLKKKKLTYHQGNGHFNQIFQGLEKRNQ